MGPLLKALRAFDPGRKRQRRGFYLVGISALFSGVALAAVIGVGLARCEVRTPSFRGAAAPMRGQRAVAAEVAALASAAPSQRDREWRRRANEVLLQPIATEISCAWNSPPQDITLVGESALGLDERGDLFACDLRDGSVAPEPVATGAWCVRPDDDGSIEVALERGGVETYVQVRRRWQRSGLTVVRTAQYGTDESLCASSLTRVSEGTRTLSLEGPSVSSLGLYYSAAPGAAPRLVGDGVVEFRTWPGLHYALVISSSVKVLDLEVGQEVVAPDPEVRNKALRLISLGGDFAVVHVFEGQLLWWRRGDDRWHRFSIAQSGIKALSVSPKGRVAVIGHAGRLQVVELESGWRYPLAEGQMRQARFLDEDHVVATDVSGHIWRWSLSSLRSKVLAEHGGRGAMWGLALSPDATMVASSSGGKDGSCVQLTSLVEGAARASSSWKMPAGTGVHALTFQDELLIAGSSDSVLHRWRWRSGEALPKVQLPKAEWIWTATPGRRRDGSSFLLIGTGRLLGERGADDLRSDKELRMGCRVLSLEGESLRSWLDQPGGGNTGIDSLDVSPDGRLGAAATSAPSLAVIDLQTGQTLVTPATSRGELRAAAFFDDGRRLFTIGDDGVVSIWSVAVGDHGLRLERRSVRSVRHGALYKLKLAAGSAFVGAEDGHISRRSLATGESEASYPGHSISITALDVDPRGTWIASGDVSGRLLLSRVDGRAPPLALSGHMADAQITNVRFLRDGRLITSSNDRTVRLWSPAYELSDAELLAELRRFVPVRSR